MGIEVTKSPPDNLPASQPAETPVAPAAAADVLRDYGQRLTDALKAKGQELAAEPAKRRALWPVAVALVAGIVTARDVLAPVGPARASAAAWGQLKNAANAGTSEKPNPAAEAPDKQSSLRAWLDEPVAPVDRNIFAFAGAGTAKAAESRSGEPKSGRNTADPKLRREASDVPAPAQVFPGRSAAASGASAGSPNVQARQIRLQSTLMGGPRPAALVNGQMVREGDVVATGSGASRTLYRVLKIEARRVILEREGIRSEIPLD
jgi:hypothetical protein